MFHIVVSLSDIWVGLGYVVVLEAPTNALCRARWRGRSNHLGPGCAWHHCWKRAREEIWPEKGDVDHSVCAEVCLCWPTPGIVIHMSSIQDWSTQTCNINRGMLKIIMSQSQWWQEPHYDVWLWREAEVGMAVLFPVGVDQRQGERNPYDLKKEYHNYTVWILLLLNTKWAVCMILKCQATHSYLWIRGKEKF